MKFNRLNLEYKIEERYIPLLAFWRFAGGDSSDKNESVLEEIESVLMLLKSLRLKSSRDLFSSAILRFLNLRSRLKGSRQFIIGGITLKIMSMYENMNVHKTPWWNVDVNYEESMSLRGDFVKLKVSVQESERFEIV